MRVSKSHWGSDIWRNGFRFWFWAGIASVCSCSAQPKIDIANHPDLNAGEVTSAQGSLYYRSIGTPKTAVALWIHGTPGGWADIRGLMVDTGFTEQVRLVSVDRPGWGRSTRSDSATGTTPADNRWGNFNDHSEAFTPLLEKLRTEYPDVPLIVAGHSWGGSFVPTLAANHPELVSGVLILASSIDPALGGPRWYNQFANTWLLQKLLGDALRNANSEIHALQQQLTLQEPRLSELTMPLLFVQGADDKLVSTQNGDFAGRVFDPARSRVVRLPDQGHLLQFERAPLIGRCIIGLATKRLQDCHE